MLEPIASIFNISITLSSDGLYYIDINKHIDGREKQYDDTKERMELEKTADMLFGGNYLSKTV